MKTLVAALITLSSTLSLASTAIFAQASEFVCACELSAGCPERLSVTISNDEARNQKYGSISYSGATTRKLKVDISEGPTFSTTSWDLFIYDSNDTVGIARLDVDPVKNPGLARDLARTPTAMLFCHVTKE